MAIALLERTIIRLSGDNVKDWLDKLVTNNLDAPLTFTALLTPQGKIIADFFVTQDGHDLLIDTPQKFSEGLIKRLKMYRLRAPIDISLDESLSVYALWNGEGEEGHLDPRHGTLGRRLITADSLDSQDDYNAHRLALGVVESQWDFETTHTFPADVNMDLMNGVDFKKGCFIGQEVVSRMKRMTKVKKRARGLILKGGATQGDKILSGERVIGEVLSSHNLMGMGLIRLDRWQNGSESPTIKGDAVEIMGGVDGSR